jgi:hypothetical protein
MMASPDVLEQVEIKRPFIKRKLNVTIKRQIFVKTIISLRPLGSLFVIYLKKLSVAQVTQCRIVRLLMNNKFERV